MENTLCGFILTGIDLYNDWGDFLDEWVAKAGTDEYLGADVAVRSGFVTDSGVFHWFFLQVTARELWRTARAVKLREPSLSRVGLYMQHWLCRGRSRIPLFCFEMFFANPLSRPKSNHPTQKSDALCLPPLPVVHDPLNG